MLRTKAWQALRQFTGHAGCWIQVASSTTCCGSSPTCGKLRNGHVGGERCRVFGAGLGAAEISVEVVVVAVEVAMAMVVAMVVVVVEYKSRSCKGINSEAGC